MPQKKESITSTTSRGSAAAPATTTTTTTTTTSSEPAEVPLVVQQTVSETFVNGKEKRGIGTITESYISCYYFPLQKKNVI